MSADAWLRKLLGPTLYLDGVQVSPSSAKWNIITGPGVVLAIAPNASTGRTDITVSADPALGTTITPATIGANQNNYSPTGWSGADYVRLVASSTYNITGLDKVATHPKKLIANVGLNAITLKHNSGSSDGDNRFDLASGTDYVLNPGAVALVFYDAVSLKWRRVG